jgi:hypothetical protein
LPTKKRTGRGGASGSPKKRGSAGAKTVRRKLAPSNTGLSASRTSSIQKVTDILQGYADKAVFRGFSAGVARGGRISYKIVWHHDRRFELILDTSKKTMSFPVLLPAIPRGSAMYRAFQEYIESRHSEELPEHRRIERKKARVRCAIRTGNVSLTLAIKDGDFEYAARKLIHLVDEIFKGFLIDGPYYEYMVEHLGLNPDQY